MKKGTALHYKTHKETARALAEQKIQQYTEHYAENGHTFPASMKRLSIRNQRTRWGSCSREGNINFNYKIALLPPRLADYIVVHELCHLGEFNHSRAFWDLVAVAIPDHRARRAELRRVERAMHARTVGVIAAESVPRDAIGKTSAMPTTLMGIVRAANPFK